MGMFRQLSPPTNVCVCSIGSGPRYQILSHVSARCASQTTHGHARVARVSRAIRVRFSHGRVLFDSHNVQNCVLQIIYLGPLPNAVEILQADIAVAGYFRLMSSPPGP